MDVPAEIRLKGVDLTPTVEDLIARGIAGLEQVCDHIISTRIALERAQGRHRTGNLYRMRIDVRIPNRSEIVVKRWSKAARKSADGLAQVQTQRALEGEPEPETSGLIGRSPIRRKGIREEQLRTLIRRAFESARRELERAVDRQRGEVKVPAQQQSIAIVERVLREQGYGFLRSLDGEQVYFHRNSVLHNHWERLKVGTAVRYAPELGEKGLQASTVEPVERPGAAEVHDELHELPVVAPEPVSRKKH